MSSTGKPKELMIEHRSLMNCVDFGIKHYAKQMDQFNFPLFTSLSFNLTQMSIFLSILTGGTLSIYNTENISLALTQILENPIVNILKLTPAHASILPEH